MFICYSSVLLFTASLPGRGTFMCHYLIGSMSTTLPSFPVGSSCARTTAPTKLSSSRCELPALSSVVWWEGPEHSTDPRDRLFPAELHGVPSVANYIRFYVCKSYTSRVRAEKAMATHSCTLAWKIPWSEEPGRPQPMGLRRVGHDWATSLSLFTFMHWRRKWQPTTVFLPGEPQGWRRLVGCRLWGRTESDTTEAT